MSSSVTVRRARLSAGVLRATALFGALRRAGALRAAAFLAGAFRAMVFFAATRFDAFRATFRATFLAAGRARLAEAVFFDFLPAFFALPRAELFRAVAFRAAA